MFEAGEQISGEKKGPAAMLEELEQMHPFSFDLPRENEIRQEISKLSREKEKKNTIGKKRKAQCLDDKHSQALEESLEENAAMMPQAAMQAMQERFEGVLGKEGHPSESQIRSKFSSLKAVRKRMRHLDSFNAPVSIGSSALR